jgi:hypothetical protein
MRRQTRERHGKRDGLRQGNERKREPDDEIAPQIPAEGCARRRSVIVGVAPR